MVFFLNSVHYVLPFLFVYISNTLCVDNDLQVEGTNREPNLSEMTQYMADLENSKKERSLPSVEVERSQTRGPSTVENISEDYNNAMNRCIIGLSEKMSTIASSIEPLVAAFNLNKGKTIDSNEVS